jgi:nitroreductase
MTIAPEAVREALGWRYATKKFDASKRIPDDRWRTLEEALIASPSSFGLQPWRFYVVEDPTTRAALRTASWNQPQITDASHLLVLARRSPVTTADVAALMERTSAVRNVPVSEFAGYRQMIEGFIARPDFDTDAWAARQVYIALGVFLSTAAMLGIDACPMEGFDASAYDERLNLPAEGFRATVVVTAGYRAADDGNSRQPKVRFARERLIGRR